MGHVDLFGTTVRVGAVASLDLLLWAHVVRVMEVGIVGEQLVMSRRVR